MNPGTSTTAPLSSLSNLGEDYIITGKELVFAIARREDLLKLRGARIIEEELELSEVPIYTRRPQGWMKRYSRVTSVIKKLEVRLYGRCHPLPINIGQSELNKTETTSDASILSQWAPADVPESVKCTEFFQNHRQEHLKRIEVWSVPTTVHSHIIVTGSIEGLSYLINVLRRSDVRRRYDIVLLLSEPPGAPRSEQII